MMRMHSPRWQRQWVQALKWLRFLSALEPLPIIIQPLGRT